MHSQLLDTLSGWPRRLAGAVCLLLAVLSLLRDRPGPTQAAVPVVTAAHVLPAGTVLRPGDLVTLRWPNATAPSGSQTAPSAVLGRTLAVALDRGSPIQSRQLLEPRLAKALGRGDVATTVSLADTGAPAILQSGSYVDLYAHDGDSAVMVEGTPSANGATAGPVASGVEVLSVLTPSGNNAEDVGPTLIIATTRTTATRLSAHVTAKFLATLVAPP